MKMAATIFTLFLLLPSCGYLRDRLKDTADIIPISVSSGPGLYAGVRATGLVGTGIGYAKVSRAGLIRRRWFRYTPPLSKFSNFRTWDETTKGWIITWYRDNDPEPGAGNRIYPDFKFTSMLGMNLIGMGPYIEDKSTKGGYRYHQDLSSLLDVEVDAHILLVGVRMGISPLQMVDWLLGWFTLDIGNDDYSKHFPETEEEEKEEEEDKKD